MRIALVTDTYRPRVNGVVTSIDTFAREFRRMGHETVVVGPAFPAAPPEPFIVRIPSHYIFFDPEDRLPDPWMPSGRRIVSSQVFAKHFDIIHTQTPFSLGVAALGWARAMKAPIVHTYHTMFESYAHYIRFLPRSLTISLAKRISRWYCNKMDLVVAPSAHMRDILAAYDVCRPIVVNPTGIKIELLQNANGSAFRQRNNISPDTPLLLFMGRIGWEKNIEFLFKALQEVRKRIPEAKMMVAGDGPARAGIMELARRMGLGGYVLFFGYFSAANWADCYAAADVFTFASVTETQGLVVTEAMAAGTPVVAVGRMGVADIMAGDRGGFLVDLDVSAFAATVLTLLKDPDLRRRKSLEARAFAREWSSEAMAGCMLTHYQQVISSRAS